MPKTKVSPKGQVVIPKELREKFDIKTGETLLVEESKEGILIRKKSKHPAQDMVGLFEGTFQKSSTELVREIRREWDNKIKRM